jgi:two-component system, OmpR family, sensor histidine kinase KdpD
VQLRKDLPPARAQGLIVRYVAMVASALLVVLVYRRILHVNQTTVALTFLVMVQIAAFYLGLVPSVCFSIFCTLLDNYFFLPPIGSLTINDPQNWVALLAFLASAIFISKISENERRQAKLSEDRRSEMERLYQFSNQLLMEENLHDVASHAPRIVASIFALDAVTLYLRESDSSYSSDPRHSFVSLEELRAAARLHEGPRPRKDGVCLVPLVLGMRASGSIAMTQAAYSEGLYDAIGGLLAIALERAAALDRFSRVEAAREGERLRTALLDSVTHELRTPLTAIRAAATSLSSQPSLAEDHRRELFLILDEESARLDRLIGQAVEMAQLDSDGIEVRLKPERLQAVIEQALEDCRTLLRGRPVTVDLPPAIPLILLDRELIRRVLRHLLENAARYSPAGSPVRISAALEPDRLLVSITDQGQGIDEAEQAYIFDKFYRGSRQRLLHGTGMGLAIAKAILRAHDGGIEVVSRRDQGATFTFWVRSTFVETINMDEDEAPDSRPRQ